MTAPRPEPTAVRPQIARPVWAVLAVFGAAAVAGALAIMGCEPAAPVPVLPPLSDGGAVTAGQSAGVAPTTAADPGDPGPPAFPVPDGPFFEDATAAAGISFRRFEGRPVGEDGVSPPGRRMFEWSGGGVAALDYDADGRPDLVFTQGRVWGPQNDPPSTAPDPAAEHRDVLYRNVGGESFVDVTAAAGFVSTGFGYGAAAGDYDGDGFQDLYICNAGPNRLLHNNGDGTFTDVTDAAGLAEDDGTGRAGAWTLSATIADLTGDGLPDIYDGNYAEGDDVFTRICAAAGQEPRVCGPWSFPAANDRFLMNMGDGTFADVTEAAGVPEGPGVAGPTIGALAADLDGAPGNELFLAIDVRPNHLLVRDRPDGDGPGGDQSAAAAGVPTFTQANWMSGIAAAGPGGTGEYACMGVACGDVDGDLRPDVFVTNYAQQPNTLYHNLSEPGAALFEETTGPALLEKPGYDTLGFGAQFLDADRDGDPDLAYVNGHLDDFTHAGSPFQMRPAFFVNDGTGRFAQVPPAGAGDFFDRPDLGRGLARLDWDGDGRDELVATHMDGPARLLRNVFDGGSGVGIRLVDTAGERDAVGSTVTVTVPTGAVENVPQGPRAMYLTAGDGYAVANGRTLNFGLGGTPDGTELIAGVTWPDGQKEAFAGVAAGGRFLLTRGRGTAVPVR